YGYRAALTGGLARQETQTGKGGAWPSPRAVPLTRLLHKVFSETVTDELGRIGLLDVDPGLKNAHCQQLIIEGLPARVCHAADPLFHGISGDHNAVLLHPGNAVIDAIVCHLGVFSDDEITR